MSGSLSAAAQALGVPEALVRRSAEARAKATGSSVDDILAAWAGGETVAAAAPPPAPTPGPEAVTADLGEPPTAEPSAAVVDVAPAADVALPTPVAPQVTGEGVPAPHPGEPPVLVGRSEHPFRIMVGAVGLFLVAFVIGFVVPATPAEGNGVYTSQIPLSESGKEGRALYLSEGCAACHTQLVRPVVADAGLGGVTVSDSNQVLGIRRFGPDLAHVGSRVESDVDLIAVLTGQGGHPSYAGLGDDDLTNLTAYLIESK